MSLPILDPHEDPMPAPSLSGATWHLREVDEAAVAALDERLHPAAARCMVLRGMDDDGAWFAPSLDHLHDPYAMCNMEAAVTRLRRALAEGHKLRVITDYDVDGTTSSLILQATLRLCARDVQLDYHIPNRFDEGYGFSVIAARKAVEDGVDLIITADIGVRDHAAVEIANAGGVDVLICDHHLPAGESVPSGAIVLCPPQDTCDYPNPHLAACGVALKLAQAMLADHPKYEAVLGSLLKLAAIGTVADMVPLATLENRAIVTLGLRSLNRGPHHAGLAALLEAADVELGQIDEQSIGFRIGPRINAAGRIANATHVVDLLNCRDLERARAMAKELDQLNQERRRLQNELVDRALEQVPDPVPDFVVVAGNEAEGWHRGVVGIVAARLKEQLHRPVAVAAISGDRATASVRSVPGVHAVKALSSAEDLLVKFGGHPAAAGFTVPTDKLDELRARLATYVSEHTDDDDLVPEFEVDASLHADDLDGRLQAQLARMRPFGMGNPEPLLMVRGVRLFDLGEMGKKRDHLRGKLGGTRQRVRFLWWRAAEHRAALESGPVDLVGQLRESTYNGRHLEFVASDARPYTG
jgi:single-stranded-DNA-specific exonuclease